MSASSSAPPWPSPPVQGRSGGVRITVVICWIIIAGIAIGLPLMRALSERSTGAAASRPTSAPATAAADADDDAVDFQTEIMGRYIVGVGAMNKAATVELIGQMSAQAKSPQQRLAVGVVTAEEVGRDAGLRVIDASGAADAADFSAFYLHAKPLPAETVQRYGFFARLAETIDAPADNPLRRQVMHEAQRVHLIGGGALVVLAIAMIMGFGLLVLAVVLAALEKLRLRVAAPRGPATIYIEAFTIYLSGLIGGSLLLSWKFPDASLYIHGLVMVAVVVVAVLWPLLRGVRWQTLREDWGLFIPSRPLMEIVFGIGGYLAGLPVVAVGVAITLLLAAHGQTTVTHPIVQLVGGHPIFVFVLASVFAPLTEETLFRGALLAHLRRRLGPFSAAGIAGLIFAAVHPQGWMAIPALASIGFVLAMIRQWRGTLLASMTAHALNNTAVLLVVMLIK